MEFLAAYDDKAFLAWYKENNPDGLIISLDLSQPNYLGDNDYLVNGDLQMILESIAKNLMVRDETKTCKNLSAS